jgi:hypothetical protein
LPAGFGILKHGGKAAEAFENAVGAAKASKTGEAADAGATASRYADITRGGSVANRATDVTRANFERNLLDAGWKKSTSKDGKVVNYEKDGHRYSVREQSKSSGGPTADYYKPGSKEIDVKIRLGE